MRASNFILHPVKRILCLTLGLACWAFPAIAGFDLAEAGCGTDDCSYMDPYGPWNYYCCRDVSTHCERWLRRTGVCSPTEPRLIGYQYRFVSSTAYPTCDSINQLCEGL